MRTFFKTNIILPVSLFLIFNITSVISQETQPNEYNKLAKMTLEELMNIPVTITSEQNKTVRESSAIVTVITKEEIKNSGAIDLADILRMIPGIYFGLDVCGVISMGIRGNWAHEGKVMLLWDGKEMNDLLYGNLQFGNHYPIEHIERIEIIRGPGSVIYGGSAELAVIKIITRNADYLNGVSANISGGVTASAPGHLNTSLSIASGEENIKVSAHLFAGKANRSDRNYIPYSGEGYNMKGNAEVIPQHFNITAEFYNLKLSYMKDIYHTTMRDYWGPVLPQAVNEDFVLDILHLSYRLADNPKWTVTPEFIVQNQNTWKRWGEGTGNIQPSGYDSPINIELDIYSRRYKEKLDFVYKYSPDFNINSGLDIHQDITDYEDTTLVFSNIAIYTQLMGKLKNYNITGGIRVENHSQYGNSLVYRLAATKKFANFHYKLLFSNAFKSPTAENIALNPQINPEITAVTEFETGFNLSKDLIWNLNLFNIQINNPIVYWSSDTDEGYNNFDDIITRGFESEIMSNFGNLQSKISYSYYYTVKNGVNIYKVPENENMVLAFPAHKVTGSFTYFPSDKAIININGTYLGSRYAIIGENSVKKYDPLLLLNINLNRHSHNSKFPLLYSIGVRNILNRKYDYIQAYDGTHSPLPGQSREIYFSLTYDLRF